MLPALAHAAASLTGAMVTNPSVHVFADVPPILAPVPPIFPSVANILKPVARPTIVLRVPVIFEPIAATFLSVSRILRLVVPILMPIPQLVVQVLMVPFRLFLAPRLPPPHELFVPLRVRLLEVLEPIVELGLALLHHFPELLRMCLLELFQAFATLFLHSFLDLLELFRVCLFEVLEPLAELPLAFLHRLTERFRVLLLQAAQPLGLPEPILSFNGRAGSSRLFLGPHNGRDPNQRNGHPDRQVSHRGTLLCSTQLDAAPPQKVYTQKVTVTFRIK